MKVSLKHFYCCLKKFLGLDRNEHWDDNPFVVL